VTRFWRRRNWLRRACTRNQSWIAVADAAATMTPEAVTAACSGEAKVSAAISGAKMTPMTISTTSILARVTRAGGKRRGRHQVGGVLARYRQPGQTARKLACRHHDHRRDQHNGGRTVGKAAPQHHGRRHQIKQLHQGLRHQPGIAPQQHEFLPAQRLLPRTGTERGCAGVLQGRRRIRRNPDDGVGEPRREHRHHGAEQHEAAGQQTQQRLPVAERRARRPPDETFKIRRKPCRSPRCQYREPRQRSIGTGSRRSAAQ